MKDMIANIITLLIVIVCVAGMVAIIALTPVGWSIVLIPVGFALATILFLVILLILNVADHIRRDINK